MRIHRVHVYAFKGLDVEFPWASAMVLFGANDSGKTNVLEGLLSNLGAERTVRTEPDLIDRNWGGGDQALVDLDVELDGLDVVGHPDQEIFLSWLLTDCVEAWWGPSVHEDDALIDALMAEEEALWAEARADFAGLDEASDRTSAVAQLVERVRALARKTRDRRLALLDESERLELGDEASESRWFKAGTAMLYWVLPGEGERSDVTLAAFVDREFLDLLAIRVVRVNASEPVRDGIYRRLEGLLEELSRRDGESIGQSSGDGYTLIQFSIVNDPWVERLGDSTSVRSVIKEACASLAARVNELAPRFVSASYEVDIVALPPDEWRAYGDRRVAVRLRPHVQGGDFDLAVASSGIAAWTSFALSEAIRLTEEELAQRDRTSEGDAGPSTTTVYVFDEPEAHLHPLAQEQAAGWLAQRALTGAHVLMATHAVPFLRLPMADVEYLKVIRSPEWETEVEPMTDDILGTVKESAEALGLPPVALIQLTRAWLVVEGEHDRMILDALCGRELRQAGIQILPLRGAARAKASFLNLAALAPLGLPFFCLLDNTRVEAIKSGQIAANAKTEEEKYAEQLLRLGKEPGVRLEVLGLPYPDIICALPMDAVRCLARENGGKPEAATSWSDLIAQHELHRSARKEGGRGTRNFKRFVLESLGLDQWEAEELVEKALRVWEGQPRPAGPLSRIVSQVVASVDDRPFDAV